MKKAFDQTVRDIKREVNKKVLKVPSIEQKALDSTSNEPWGPHGSLLADISQATRNYHEYQMIMNVIWKRINDTGKNWRHVYKALIVLEYLVANGSERVIDEIKEHAYQISTLSNFQYIDSSGRDQGSNVKRKSASLVDLVNDKERIIEVRQKAAANREKFRGPSTGGTYKLSSYASTRSYGERCEDDRYGSKDDAWGYRESDRYSRSSDPYGHEVERHSRDSDERDGRDDELRGRRHSISDYQPGSRSRSADRERPYDDESQDGRRIGRKFSEQNLGAPPTYEEATASVQSPASNSRHNEEHVKPVNPHLSPPRPVQVTTLPAASTSPTNQDDGAFDEFDPRSSTAAAAPPTNSTEFDLLGSLLEAVPSNALAIIPSALPENHTSVPSFEAASSSTFDDPFGDSPFKAISPEELTETHHPMVQNPNLTLPETQHSQFTATSLQNTEAALPETAAAPPNTVPDFDFGETYGGGLAYTGPGPSVPFSPSANALYLPQEPLSSNPYTDILAGILPPPDVAQQPVLQLPAQQLFPHNFQTGEGVLPPPLQPATQPVFPPAGGHFRQTGEGVSVHDVDFLSPFQQQQNDGYIARAPSTPMTSSVPAPITADPIRPSKPNFEPKSTVWADTLSRGLVNLNISGPKTNPLADIGVDFDAINRKEKRMEKPAANPVTMGKAMGSGSGIGRVAASSLRAPPNMMMGMNMGTMGMNQPGMGMNMGYGMGVPPQPPQMHPPGSVMPGRYNPAVGGGYMPPPPPHQQQYPYGGGYR